MVRAMFYMKYAMPVHANSMDIELGMLANGCANNYIAMLKSLYNLL